MSGAMSFTHRVRQISGLSFDSLPARSSADPIENPLFGPIGGGTPIPPSGGGTPPAVASCGGKPLKREKRESMFYKDVSEDRVGGENYIGNKGVDI